MEFSKRQVFAWISFWKIGDAASTIYLANRFGWGGEKNPLPHLLSQWMTYEQTMLVQIGVGIGLAYILYDRHPYLAEAFMFVFPGLVIGNFANLIGAPYVHFVWVGLLVVFWGYRTYMDWKGKLDFSEPLWISS